MQELLNCCLRVPRAPIESGRKVVSDFPSCRSAVGNVVQHSAVACRVLLVVLQINLFFNARNFRIMNPEIHLKCLSNDFTSSPMSRKTKLVHLAQQRFFQSKTKHFGLIHFASSVM